MTKKKPIAMEGARKSPVSHTFIFNCLVIRKDAAQAAANPHQSEKVPNPSLSRGEKIFSAMPPKRAPAMKGIKITAAKYMVFLYSEAPDLRKLIWRVIKPEITPKSINTG